MKKKVKLLIVTMVSVIMAAMISSPVIAAPKVDFDKMEKCILKFFTPIYESMLAESTTCFSKDDYPTVESYLVAKTIEAKRDYYLIDYDGGITDVSINSIRILKESIDFSGSNVKVEGVIDYSYRYSQYETESAEKFHFYISIDSNDNYVVNDVIAFDEGWFEANRRCIASWKELCKDFGDEWEFEAINRIVNSKKVDLDELIDIQEFEPEPEPPQRKSLANMSSTTVSYNSSAAATYAYITAPYSYDPNYIFRAVTKDCTNFVSQCVWAGYGGTSGYALPSTPSQNYYAIVALRNRVQNDYRMVPGSWYGRYWRESYVVPPANWCGVTDFWDYAVGNTGNGPVATGFNNNKKWNQYSGTIRRGDVLQFRYPDESIYRHSAFVYTSGSHTISSISDAESIFLCQHTNNSQNKPLSDEIRQFSYGTPDSSPCYMRRMRFYDATFSS